MIKTCISLLLCAVLCFGSLGQAQAQEKAYGVFLGMDAAQLMKLKNYDLLVCDAQYLSTAQIAQLKAQGNRRIFTYLNIGSLENFREYYKDYVDLTLGDYENWPEERWVDVSQQAWQDFVQKLAAGLSAKGVDGWFIDNCDVYYNYPKDTIYEGLNRILERLGTLGLPALINGGSDYVERALTEKRQDLFWGINQESVFSSIDFEKQTFGKNTPETFAYFRDYVENCAKAGLAVYLLEYSTDAELIRQIQEYCAKKGFVCYVSRSIELNEE